MQSPSLKRMDIMVPRYHIKEKKLPDNSELRAYTTEARQQVSQIPGTGKQQADTLISDIRHTTADLFATLLYGPEN